MPSKRQVLDQLKRDELIVAVERFELPVDDRRRRNLLIEALASFREATLEEILGDLKRARLKELCRALGLENGGREKAVIIERLTRKGSATPRPAESVARRRATPARASTVKPAPAKTEPNNQIESRLWARPRFEVPEEPPKRPRRKPINIQDSYLFGSLKEGTVLAFALVTGKAIKGRIKRFDQYAVLIDDGTRETLIYKHAIVGITEMAG